VAVIPGESGHRDEKGENVAQAASYARLFCSQVAIRAVGKAMEVFGGYGFAREFPIQRFYRDLEGIGFGVGTDQIQRVTILRNLLNGAAPFPV